MTSLKTWEARVKKRRSAIMRAIRTRANQKYIDDMMYYGIMNSHKKHWHKIDGVWYLDVIKSSRRKRSTSARR